MIVRDCEPTKVRNNGSTKQRTYESMKLRKCETVKVGNNRSAKQRKWETAKLQSCETAEVRDNESTKGRDGPIRTPCMAYIELFRTFALAAALTHNERFHLI